MIIILNFVIGHGINLDLYFDKVNEAIIACSPIYSDIRLISSNLINNKFF